MSTSHRPQLEARSGAKAAGYTGTAIEHARKLPGHKSVKYRVQKVDKEMSGRSSDEKKGADDQDNTAESEGSDESEEEDETERLLLELESLQGKEGDVKPAQTSDEKDTAAETTIPAKKKAGWRSGNTFSRGKVAKSAGSEKKSEKYINNIIKSDYHQDFINKIVK